MLSPPCYLGQDKSCVCELANSTGSREKKFYLSSSTLCVHINVYLIIKAFYNYSRLFSPDLCCIYIVRMDALTSYNFTAYYCKTHSVNGVKQRLCDATAFHLFCQFLRYHDFWVKWWLKKRRTAIRF